MSIMSDTSVPKPEYQAKTDDTEDQEVDGRIEDPYTHRKTVTIK